MKKSLIVFLAVAALALWGGAAQAAITGTSHAITGAAGGACGACHIPHASGGSRLWVENPVSGTAPAAYVGSVAPLCGYCHYSNMGGGQVDALSDAYVYGTYSHGRLMAEATQIPWGQVASGLPYMTDAADGNIECTSCHNVHDDTARPFLRAGINEICSMCHGFRRWNGTAWVHGTTAGASAVAAWTGTDTGDGNPGSHPVGTDITGNVYNGGSPIVFPAIMAVGVTDIADNWTLGGHRLTGQTGGVICVTCHAVHGIQYDASGPAQGITSTDNSTPNVNFLAVEQASGTLNNRSVANGIGGYNGLCEACHQGSESSTYNATNTTYPNPGATSYGHPVDDMAVVGGASWVTAFPTNWPAGQGWTGSDGDPNPICESCHVLHAYADSTRADNTLGTFRNSEFILRDSRWAICGNCHITTGGQRHHPVGLTFQSPATGAANYLENVAAGANTLECATCHTDGGAHNWDAKGAVNLDASWVPAANARSSTYNAGMSKTCMDCHNNLTGVFRWSPTKNDGVSTNPIFSPGGEGYDLHGNASHYIGELDPRNNYPATGAAYWTSVTGGLGAWINPETTAWSAAFGGAGGYSRFGGTSTAPVLVCESCHELEHFKNSSTHLLLAPYTEQTLGAAFTRTADFLCNGCHLPRGTHQMTNDPVSSNRQAGATALNTDTATAWLATPTSGPTMGQASGDQFTCDSCHQPHDAPTPGRTYILDASASVLDNAGQTLIAGTTANYGTAYATSIDSEATQVNYQRFCDKCHPYN